MIRTRRQTFTTLLAAAAAPMALGAFTRQAVPGGAPAPAAPAFGPAPTAELVSRARAALAPGGLVERLMEGLAQQGRFSGVVLAAVDGRPLFQKAYGMADRAANRPNALETRFNIASAGKMFTTVGIGQLLEAGKLRLDDRLIDHLPDVRADIGGRITISHLLEHTSGLGSYFNAPSWNERRPSIRTVADYLAVIGDEPLQFTPGERYEYSNSGFTLLGAVIERLTGRDYYAAMQERVFAPAGMTATGYPAPDELAADRAVPYHNGCFGRPPNACTPGEWQDGNGISAVKGGPAGGAFSTVGDLNRFVEALKGGRLLKPETLNLMKAERGKMIRQGGPLDAYAYGFGRLTIFGQPTWGHNGGTVGAGAQVDVFEDAPVTLILLANQDGAQRPGSSVLRRSVAPPGWTPPAAQPGAGPVMVRPGG